MSSPSLSSAIEQMADREPDVSMREFLTRIFIRPWLFLLCVLLPPVLAIALTAQIPPTYEATVKILIRYSASESAFLKDLIPENRVPLSGASSAELIRSIPVLVDTIRNKDIRAEDIARRPMSVLSGRLAEMFESPAREGPAAGLPGMDPKTLQIAKDFKDSLEESSAFGGSKRKPVEVLERPSPLSSTMKGDELINLTVTSFNREKVADMANGLAESFIREYARLTAEEARRSADFLGRLIEDTQQAGADASLPRLGKRDDSTESGREDAFRQSPLLENLASELAAKQVELARLSGIYSSDSTRVARARAEVEAIRATLGTQEGQEINKLVLEQLKVRRYQALNTEKLFRSGIVPVSIVEPAFTPRQSAAKNAMRYALSGGVGLVLGLLLGLGLVVLFTVTDQRIYTAWDVEKALQLPLLGSLPTLGVRRRFKGRQPFLRYRGGEVEDGLLRLLGRLDALLGHRPGQVLAVASASDREGKTFVVTGLASLLARGGKRRVLLVDADLQQRGLSLALGAGEVPGLVECILESAPLASRVVASGEAGVDLLPAGDVLRRAELGFYRAEFQQRVAEIQDDYDFILIDTSSALKGNEALMCGKWVDALIWVVSARMSRRPAVRAALGRLREAGIQLTGVVLNRRRAYLPTFLWRHV